MSRRTSNDQERFGSDSFLDIVANIVGILIILIVVAGLRVSRAPVPIRPVDVPPLSDKEVPEAETDTIDVVETPSRSTTEELVAEMTQEADADVTPDPEVSDAEVSDPVTEPAAEVLVPPSPPEELVQRSEALKAAIETLREKHEEETNQLRKKREEEKHLQKDLGQTSDALAAVTAEVASARDQASASAEALKRAKELLASLLAEIERLDEDKPPPTVIEHRVTPISHEVLGPEVHFRLERNRVSVVPLEGLLERLKEQIDRQKDWLLRYRRHEGEVGPVEGFTMRYVIERKALSVFEELQHGRGIVRIAVTQWRIEPNQNLIAETAGEAQRVNSAFQAALLTAPYDATLTFWIYPDSFALYRQLQQIAQRHGFTVAARPLPFGVPIAGSPRGSRSAGQ